MKEFLEPILNLIFPPRCEVCKEGSQESLCPKCFGQIKFMKPQMGIHGISVYEGVLKTAIHRFKFQKRKTLADPLGILVVKYLGRTPSLDMNEIDAIVPVPLHSKRLRSRGFNQAKLLAEVVSRYYGIPVVSSLERVRDTRAQFDLPRDERFKNVKGAFRVSDSKAVYNRRLLLLDDIYTTGATIAECSNALKVAGARRVEIVTLSRAVDSAP